jgi:HAD superfamily hydrolase (TIGR01509 family)
MDGLLLDSEPAWKGVHREVFAALGMRLEEWPSLVTTGMRVDEVVALRRTYFDWGEPTDTEVVLMITQRVAERLTADAVLLPGAIEAIDWCRDHGLAVALATGSTWTVLEAVTRRFALDRHLDALVSAEDVQLGKPHPAVFMTAAAAIGVEPTACLAFEDSLNGVIAAKAASMRVVAVPRGASAGDPRMVLADVLLDSLHDIGDGRVAALAGLELTV